MVAISNTFNVVPNHVHLVVATRRRLQPTSMYNQGSCLENIHGRSHAIAAAYSNKFFMKKNIMYSN